MCTHSRFKIGRLSKQTGQVHIHLFAKHLLSSYLHHKCAVILKCFKNVFQEPNLKDNKINDYRSAECPKVCVPGDGGHVRVDQYIFNTALCFVLTLYAWVLSVHVSAHLRCALLPYWADQETGSEQAKTPCSHSHD